MDHSEDLEKILGELEGLVKKAGYDEFYGYQMDPKGEFYDSKIASKLIYKLLKAYNFNLEETRRHFVDILKWRGEFDPLSAAFLEKHDPKFDKIGVMTLNPDGQSGDKVITWNLYGTIDNSEDVFGRLDEFMRWRVGIMEQAINQLDFDDTTNDYMAQVHDYKGASLFSMTGDAKKASTSIIKMFGDYYPEVLSRKYFVNVPALMAFLFNAFKAFVAEATRKKLVMLRHGVELSDYIDGVGVPKSYGGKSGKGLDELRFIFDKDRVRLPAYVSYLLETKVTNEVD
ncbi:DEKNAAC103484 [Brettanomyces naardenensis]|uniref:Phosphatidylinositol transfer protein SFH5 n=1 Tax=Brettanomyces naardenensis TaxID=13370 RepID=A0A448YNT4_BRENA|nr:DEKNAAC103484 [Brettanomyces naardenensis]